MNKKGIALILSFIVIVVLTILGMAIISRSISEGRIVQRYIESTQAFWLAEAGVNRALKELKSDYNITGNSLWPSGLGQGRYSVDVANVTVDGESCKRVTVHGFIPYTEPTRAERIIETIMCRYIPPNFYDYAIYAVGDIELKGNAYSVVNNEPSPDNKAILYADKFEASHPENITGTVTKDSSISPLALLDFQQLLTISQGQGNVYDETRLENVQRGRDFLPSSFWYTAPTDPADPTTGTPNVVYVTEDLELNGNIGTIGGFFVVVGDVITNPTATYNTEINGNGQIEGIIYTRGTFEVNGGGPGLNVNGGVLAGEEAELRGNADVTYNQDYMLAIKALDINPDVQIKSWRDTQSPY